MRIPRNEKNLLCAGLAAFCILFGGSLAMVLSGCSYASAPAGTDELSLAIQESAKLNKDGTVSVVVPLPSGEASRSINTAYVKTDVDFYEVVFRSTGDDPTVYYRGEAKASKGYISASVLPGLTYDVLLLAGNDKILLAAAYRGTNDGVANSDPDTNGPVTIEAGKANVIKLSPAPIALQWDAPSTPGTLIGANNDFEFSVSGLDTSDPSGSDDDQLEVNGGGRFIQISRTLYTDDSVKDLPRFIYTSEFTVKFNLSKLAPLIKASPVDTSSNYLFSLKTQDVLITPLAGSPSTEKFDDVKLITNAVITGSNVAIVAEGGSEYKIAKSTDLSANFITASFTNKGTNAKGEYLPRVNADGKLLFRLTYYAFSGDASVGREWFIQNGLNNEIDTPSPKASDPTSPVTTGGGTGGAFLVKFGKGGSGNLVDGKIIFPLGNDNS
ncbi:MAG: hypothetical protein LBU18_04840 [Treponema sp.]|jgi:hypothetical protein|nr:hypothetical protein [Treponema sp.]